MPGTVNDIMTLPLMIPTMPEMTKTGLLELLSKMLATPAARGVGGKLIRDTVALEGHEKPAPRSVIVHVETLIAFNDKCIMMLSVAPVTDEMGADREARLSAAQVVANVY